MITEIVMLLSTLINILIIITIANSFQMGALHFHFSGKCRQKEFVITKANRIDLQKGYECSGFSSAYILRHWDIEEQDSKLYEIIPNKANTGLVSPKGILNILSRYCLKVKYCAGNIAALKNEVSKGNPVIVMIRVLPDQNWLHFVPVVGYDEQYILENASGIRYSRNNTKGKRFRPFRGAERFPRAKRKGAPHEKKEIPQTDRGADLRRPSGRSVSPDADRRRRQLSGLAAPVFLLPDRHRRPADPSVDLHLALRQNKRPPYHRVLRSRRS